MWIHGFENGWVNIVVGGGAGGRAWNYGLLLLLLTYPHNWWLPLYLCIHHRWWPIWHLQPIFSCCPGIWVYTIMLYFVRWIHIKLREISGTPLYLNELLNTMLVIGVPLLLSIDIWINKAFKKLISFNIKGNFQNTLLAKANVHRNGEYHIPS